MEILDFIPVGSENAVSRAYLCAAMGLRDRQVRQSIHEARRKMPIINLSEGEGYYIPDMNTLKDRDALLQYVRQEENRLKSIGWALRAARQTLKNCGIEVGGHGLHKIKPEDP